MEETSAGQTHPGAKGGGGGGGAVDVDSEPAEQVRWRRKQPPSALLFILALLWCNLSHNHHHNQRKRRRWVLPYLLLLLPTLSLVSSSAILPQPPRRELTVDTYEPVFYSTSEILSQRSRVKREIGSGESVIKFSLHTKSRDFHLSLQPDLGVFHPQLVIENGDGSPHLDYEHKGRAFHGVLVDDPGSRVEGFIDPEGHFDGVIKTSGGDQFHVEPSHIYDDFNKMAQGVMYEQSSVQWPDDKEGHHETCLSHKLHEATKKSANHSDSSSSRSKRTKRYALDPRRKTCMLYLQADHLFYKHFGSEEAAINMMARHIQRVNEIYRGTDFDGDGLSDQVSFMIKRIKVYNTNGSLAPDYKYDGDFQVITFLEKFSEGDYESFCLAYMFTFRDFEGGTLGLAWTGDLKNAGGVCERKGHFRGGLKSLNTGIITLLNYGKVVLPAVSFVTLAHEIGHNFGSPHDPDVDRECVPGGKDGNFIMYARATAGDQKNNQRFSPCSLRTIMPVLNAKARNIHGCFTEPQRGICGNREVEEGEECDCGWEEDCAESCCWPMKLKYERHEVPCTLKPRKECSPSQGPCCTESCTLKAGNKCRDDNGCRHRSYCDGLTPQCPSSVHKPNRTVCLDGQNVCFMGECTGSICLAYGLDSCQCSPQPWDSSSKYCELCCKKPGEGEACLSSFEWNEAPFDVPDFYAKPGSPCKNYTGYCDAYRTCREVDPSGPLATLRNLLLADEGLSAIAHWIDEHWYAVISLVVLLIVMMGLTAKLCGKQAKKKLRKITILHSNLGTVPVERSYWDEAGEHVVHPAAVRKKIPLRKKIRDKNKKKKGVKPGRRRGEANNGTQAQVPSAPLGEVDENETVLIGIPIPPASSSRGGKAPRYGTLWRKKQRDRAGVTKASKGRRSSTETPSSSPQKGTNSEAGEQSFDLVQLHTPPPPPTTISANHNPSASFANPDVIVVASSSIYPSLGPAAAAISNPNPPSSSTRGGTNTNVISHEHEPKTVILPNSSSSRPGQKGGGGGGGRSQNNNKRSGPEGGNKRGSSSSKAAVVAKRSHHGGGSSSQQNPQQQRRKSTTASSERQRSSTSSSATTAATSVPQGSVDTSTKPKKSFQIVYTPPFSVRVVHAEAPQSPPPSQSQHINPLANPANNGRAKQSTKAKGIPLSPIFETPLPPIPTEEGNNNPSGGIANPLASPLPSDGVPPPPYSPPEDKAKSPESSTPSSSVKPSKVKSSNSFIQRRSRLRGREKGELKVLIPPPNQFMDEEGETPTPGT